MDPLSGLVVAVLAFVGSLLGGYTREYFASRGREEGKIDAIQDNLAKVLEQLRETTRTAEAVKAVIVGGLWVEQERWKLKRDAYMSLLTSLRVAGICLFEAQVVGRDPAERVRVLTEALKRDQEPTPEHFQESQRMRTAAELVVSDTALEVSRELTVRIAELSKTPALLEDHDHIAKLMAAHKDAYRKLLAAARADLELKLKD